VNRDGSALLSAKMSHKGKMSQERLTFHWDQSGWTKSEATAQQYLRIAGGNVHQTSFGTSI